MHVFILSSLLFVIEFEFFNYANNDITNTQFVYYSPVFLSLVCFGLFFKLDGYLKYLLTLDYIYYLYNFEA